MASSATPLCPQNKNQKDYRGRFEELQEVNKVSENLRNRPCTAQSSKRGSENHDPNEAAKPLKGPNKLKSVSRLPVLAKSLQPVLTDVSQTLGHKRWEERPLLGKAQKRKTCTKPVPFSLHQSRTHGQMSTETASEKAKSGMHLTRPPRHTPFKTLSVTEQRPKNRTPTLNTLGNTHVAHTSNTKTIPLSRESHTDAQSEYKGTKFMMQIVNDSCNGIGSSIQCDLSTQLGSITLAHSELTQDQSHSFRTGEAEDQAVCQPKAKSCIQTLLSADCTTGSGVSFSPDPSARHSILQNEGVKEGGPVGATPRASVCPSGRETSIYSARRVPVKNSQKGAATADPRPTGNVLAVPFSPDPSALPKICQNGNVKVGGPVGAMPRVSTCPSGRETSICSAQRVPLKKPQKEVTAVSGCSGNAVPFSPDPSALHSILQNEGIKVSGATPRVSTCPSGRGTSIYSAQRVPVKKARAEGTATEAAHAGNAVPFSPDPSALRSILQNEGIKVSGATPRVSTCPSGRGTSIYSAQRVPVKKARAEGTATEAAHGGASRTPATKWTPKRVPYSQSQSLRRIISAPKTPLFSASSGISETQASGTDSSTQQDGDVVQRLFQEEPEQDESEEMVEGGNKTTSGLPLEPQQPVEPHLRHEENADHQPFIQAPHRQSVIVFSSGQRLLRAGPTHGGAQTLELRIPDCAEQLQNCATSSEAEHIVPVQFVHSESQSAQSSDIRKRMTPSALCKTKASFSSAVFTLRRRLPPLEEMFLDEECATYTSCQQSWPAQPRCSNPVASILLFQDSTCFVPIGLTSPSLSPVPHLSSSIRA